MAKRRKKVPLPIRRQLIAEAGNKCANPGCDNWQTHIHHIKHWAIYQTHDMAHMIAVCPYCHDVLHRNGGISDETLYRWKGIKRVDDGQLRGHLFVEPAKDVKLLLGSMCAVTENETVVFELSNATNFKMKLRGDEIFLTDCMLRDLSGRELVTVFDNYVSVINDRLVRFEKLPGKICITSLDADSYLPSWTKRAITARPDIVKNNQTKIFEIEVIRPGVIRFQGAFVSEHTVFAVTDTLIYLFRVDLNGAIALKGNGENTILKIDGKINRAIFSAVTTY